VRRKFVHEKYADLVEALYGEAERVPVRAVFKYQDGSEQVVETEVRIHDVVREREAV